MADRLYLGPINKQLRGNREDALTLEREARTKVGYLFDSMRPGETFKTGSWSLLGGRRIMAFVWNDVLGKRATVRLTGVGGEISRQFVLSETGWLVVADDPDRVYSWNELITLLRLSVDTDNSFASEIASHTNLGTAPHTYSGLTRLLAQSLAAKDRSIESLFGEIVAATSNPGVAAAFSNTDPMMTIVGCVRSPTNDYWVVAGGYDSAFTPKEEQPATFGLYAVKLAFGAETIDLLSMATSSGYSKLERTLFDATILNYVSPKKENGEVVFVELFAPTDEEFTQVYKSTTLSLSAPYSHLVTDHLTPKFWGWCWRYQGRAEDDEHTAGATVVTQFPYIVDSGFASPIISRKADLTFVWDDEGIPTATITVTGDEVVNAAHEVVINFVDGNYQHESWATDPDYPFDHPTSTLWQYAAGTLTPLYSPKLVDTSLGAEQNNYIASWFGKDGEQIYIKSKDEVVTSYESTIGSAPLYLGTVTEERDPFTFAVGYCGEIDNGVRTLDYSRVASEAGCTEPILTAYTSTQIDDMEYPISLIVSSSPGVVFCLIGPSATLTNTTVAGYDPALQQYVGCSNTGSVTQKDGEQQHKVATDTECVVFSDVGVAEELFDATIVPSYWEDAPVFETDIDVVPAYNVNGVITGVNPPAGIVSTVFDTTGIFIGGA